MKKMEELLGEQKLNMDVLEVPEELEGHLRTALKNRKPSSNKKKYRNTQIAAAILALMIIGYHFDTVAFYGRKFIGYDQIMSENLKQLNELGKGQAVDKSYTFKNGIEVTLDGIMLDDNQLIALYTLSNLNRGGKDLEDVHMDMWMEGQHGRYYMHSSIGMPISNGNKSEVRYVAKFERPKFLEKNLVVNFRVNEENKTESAEIPFELDRKKAMGHTLKRTLNKRVKVEETTIKFESIVASPTVTVIKGSIRSIIDLALDQITGKRFRPTALEVRLIVNGREMQQQGSGMTTDMKGMTFQIEYDPLPENIKDLKIQLVRFEADYDVDQRVQISPHLLQSSVTILGQKVDINKIDESKGDTYITITTEESVVLTEVYLIIEGEKVQLEETILSQYDKKPDGKIYHTRTLHFKGTGKNLELEVKKIKYSKEYKQILNLLNP